MTGSRAAAALVLLAALGPAGARRARAQDDGQARVAVLDLEAGEGQGAVATAATRALRRAVATRVGWRLVEEGGLSVTEAKLTYACLDEDPSCWCQVGVALGVDLLLVGGVSPADEDAAVAVQLFDVRAVRLVDRLDRIFPAARIDERLAAAAREFVSPAADAERTVLRVQVEPDGAGIYVDNAYLGESPVPEAPLEPGRHEVLIRLRGYIPDRRVVEARAGQAVDLHVTLRPDRIPIPPAGEGGSPEASPGGLVGGASAAQGPGRAPASSRSFLGWGILGSGATLGGVGLLFGALAQDAADEFAEPRTPERRAYELRDLGERYAAGANALFGVGAALCVTGAVLLVSGPDDGNVAAAAGPGGAALVVGF